ncbi:hypothetical protein [Amycolatopsis sp. Hca4]|uniref:hypothetical protein n=1 Tax=Amycolatopsis sp. Hca4 TaxID=2742131 RepID=UPI0015927182|nr:hypothetical protein [Amycolatopsis sp. Hca4]QKV74006.1 hypothetical protein HUT10_09655 [Amycolatopsis sp. Hca4]
MANALGERGQEGHPVPGLAGFAPAVKVRYEGKLQSADLPVRVSSEPEAGPLPDGYPAVVERMWSITFASGRAGVLAEDRAALAEQFERLVVLFLRRHRLGLRPLDVRVTQAFFGRVVRLDGADASVGAAARELFARALEAAQPGRPDQLTPADLGQEFPVGIRNIHTMRAKDPTVPEGYWLTVHPDPRPGWTAADYRDARELAGLPFVPGRPALVDAAGWELRQVVAGAVARAVDRAGADAGKTAEVERITLHLERQVGESEQTNRKRVAALPSLVDALVSAALAAHRGPDGMLAGGVRVTPPPVAVEIGKSGPGPTVLRVTVGQEAVGRDAGRPKPAAPREERPWPLRGEPGQPGLQWRGTRGGGQRGMNPASLQTLWSWAEAVVPVLRARAEAGIEPPELQFVSYVPTPRAPETRVQAEKTARKLVLDTLSRALGEDGLRRPVGYPDPAVSVVLRHRHPTTRGFELWLLPGPDWTMAGYRAAGALDVVFSAGAAKPDPVVEQRLRWMIAGAAERAAAAGVDRFPVEVELLAGPGEEELGQTGLRELESLIHDTVGDAAGDAVIAELRASRVTPEPAWPQGMIAGRVVVGDGNPAPTGPGIAPARPVRLVVPSWSGELGIDPLPKPRGGKTAVGRDGDEAPPARVTLDVTGQRGLEEFAQRLAEQWRRLPADTAMPDIRLRIELPQGDAKYRDAVLDHVSTALRGLLRRHGADARGWVFEELVVRAPGIETQVSLSVTPAALTTEARVRETSFWEGGFLGRSAATVAGGGRPEGSELSAAMRQQLAWRVQGFAARALASGGAGLVLELGFIAFNAGHGRVRQAVLEPLVRRALDGVPEVGARPGGVAAFLRDRVRYRAVSSKLPWVPGVDLRVVESAEGSTAETEPGTLDAPSPSPSLLPVPDAAVPGVVEEGGTSAVTPVGESGPAAVVAGGDDFAAFLRDYQGDLGEPDGGFRDFLLDEEPFGTGFAGDGAPALTGDEFLRNLEVMAGNTAGFGVDDFFAAAFGDQGVSFEVGGSGEISPGRAESAERARARVRALSRPVQEGDGSGRVRVGVVLGDPALPVAQAAGWLPAEAGVFGVVLVDHTERRAQRVADVLVDAGWDGTDALRLYACDVDGLAVLADGLSRLAGVPVARPIGLLWLGADEVGPAVRVGGFSADGRPLLDPAGSGAGWVWHHPPEALHPAGWTEPGSYELPVPGDAPARLGLTRAEHLAGPGQAGTSLPDADRRSGGTAAPERPDAGGTTEGRSPEPAGHGTAPADAVSVVDTGSTVSDSGGSSAGAGHRASPARRHGRAGSESLPPPADGLRLRRSRALSDASAWSQETAANTGAGAADATVLDGLERAERARLDHPVVLGEPDFARLREAVLVQLAQVGERREDWQSWVAGSFPDEVLRQLDRTLETIHDADRDVEIEIQAVRIGAPMDEVRGVGEIGHEYRGERRLSEVQAESTRTPLNPTKQSIPAGPVTVGVELKDPGVTSARRMRAGSEVGSTTEVRERGELSRSDHVVVHRVLVRPRPGRMRHRNRPGVVREVPVPMRLEWPHHDAAAGASGRMVPLAYPQAPRSASPQQLTAMFEAFRRARKAIGSVRFTGLAGLYDRLVEELQLDRAGEVATDLDRWLDRIGPEHGVELFTGGVARRTFQLPGHRRPVEIMLARRLDPDAVAEFVGRTELSVGRRRRASSSHGVEHRETQGWGGELSVGLGEDLLGLAGGKLSVGMSYGRQAEHAEQHLGEVVNEATERTSGEVEKYGVPFTFVVSAAEVDQSAYREQESRRRKLWHRHESPRVAFTFAAGARLVLAERTDPDTDRSASSGSRPDSGSRGPAGLPREHVLDSVRSAWRLTENTLVDLAGRLARRLVLDEVVPETAAQRVRDQLIEFLDDRHTRALLDGGDGVRFPLDGAEKDLFLVGELDPERGQYLGPVPSKDLTGTITARDEKRVEQRRRREKKLGVSVEGEAGPVSLSGALALAEKKNRGGLVSRAVQREQAWSGDADIHQFTYPVVIQARLGTDRAHLDPPLRWRTETPAGAEPEYRAGVSGRLGIKIAARTGLGAEPDPAPVAEETGWLDADSVGAGLIPSMRPGTLPVDYDLDAVAPVRGLQAAVTELLRVPAAEGTPATLSAVAKRLLLGAPSAPLGDRGEDAENASASQEALETWAGWTSRQGRLGLAAGPSDVLTLESYNAGSDVGLGGRDLTGTAALSTVYGNPRIVDRDLDHAFGAAESTQTVLTNDSGKQLGVPASFGVSASAGDAFTGGGEVSAGYHRGPVANEIDVVSTRDEHRRVERAYLVEFDARHLLGTSVHERLTGPLGGRHDRPAVTGERVKFVPRAVRVWVPASELPSIGELSPHDVRKNLFPEDRPLSAPVTPAAQPAGGSELGRYEPARPDLVTELVDGLRSRLRDWEKTIADQDVAADYAVLHDAMARAFGDRLLLGGFDGTLRNMLNGGEELFAARTGKSGKLEQLVVLKAERTTTRPRGGTRHTHRSTVTTNRLVRNGVVSTVSYGFTGKGTPTIPTPGFWGAGFLLGGAVDPTVTAEGSRTKRGGPVRTEKHTTVYLHTGRSDRHEHGLKVGILLRPWARSGVYRRRIPLLRQAPVTGLETLPGLDVATAVRSTVPALPAGGSALDRQPGSLREHWRRQGSTPGIPEDAVVSAWPFPAPRLQNQLMTLLGRLNARRGYGLLAGSRADRLSSHFAAALTETGHGVSVDSKGVSVDSKTVASVAITFDLTDRELVGIIPGATVASHHESGEEADTAVATSGKFTATPLGGLPATFAGDLATYTKEKTGELPADEADRTDVAGPEQNRRVYLVRATLNPTITLHAHDGTASAPVHLGPDGTVSLRVDEAGARALGLDPAAARPATATGPAPAAGPARPGSAPATSRGPARPDPATALVRPLGLGRPAARARVGAILGDPASKVGRAASWLPAERGVLGLVLLEHTLRDVPTAVAALRAANWNGLDRIRLYACNVNDLDGLGTALHEAVGVDVAWPKGLLWLGIDTPGTAVRVGDTEFTADGRPRFREQPDGWRRAAKSRRFGRRNRFPHYTEPVPADAPPALGLAEPEHLAPPFPVNAAVEQLRDWRPADWDGPGTWRDELERRQGELPPGYVVPEAGKSATGATAKLAKAWAAGMEGVQDPRTGAAVTAPAVADLAGGVFSRQMPRRWWQEARGAAAPAATAVAGTEVLWQAGFPHHRNFVAAPDLDGLRSTAADVVARAQRRSDSWLEGEDLRLVLHVASGVKAETVEAKLAESHAQVTAVLAESAAEAGTVSSKVSRELVTHKGGAARVELVRFADGGGLPVEHYRAATSLDVQFTGRAGELPVAHADRVQWLVAGEAWRAATEGRPMQPIVFVLNPLAGEPTGIRERHRAGFEALVETAVRDTLLLHEAAGLPPFGREDLSPRVDVRYRGKFLTSAVPVRVSVGEPPEEPAAAPEREPEAGSSTGGAAARPDSSRPRPAQPRPRPGTRTIVSEDVARQEPGRPGLQWRTKITRGNNPADTADLAVLHGWATAMRPLMRARAESAIEPHDIFILYRSGASRSAEERASLEKRARQRVLAALKAVGAPAVEIPVVVRKGRSTALVGMDVWLRDDPALPIRAYRTAGALDAVFEPDAEELPVAVRRRVSWLLEGSAARAAADGVDRITVSVDLLHGPGEDIFGGGRLGHLRALAEEVVERASDGAVSVRLQAEAAEEPVWLRGMAVARIVVGDGEPVGDASAAPARLVLPTWRSGLAASEGRGTARAAFALDEAGERELVGFAERLAGQWQALPAGTQAPDVLIRVSVPTGKDTDGVADRVTEVLREALEERGADARDWTPSRLVHRATAPEAQVQVTALPTPLMTEAKARAATTWQGGFNSWTPLSPGAVSRAEINRLSAVMRQQVSWRLRGFVERALAAGRAGDGPFLLIRYVGLNAQQASLRRAHLTELIESVLRDVPELSARPGGVPRFVEDHLRYRDVISSVPWAPGVELRLDEVTTDPGTDRDPARTEPADAEHDDFAEFLRDYQEILGIDDFGLGDLLAADGPEAGLPGDDDHTAATGSHPAGPAADSATPVNEAEKRLESWRPWTSESATWREEWERLHAQQLLPSGYPAPEPGDRPKGPASAVFRRWGLGMLGQQLAGRPAFTAVEIVQLAGPAMVNKRTVYDWKKLLPADDTGAGADESVAGGLVSWRPWASESPTWLAELESLRERGLLPSAYTAPAEGERVPEPVAKLLRFWLLGMQDVVKPDSSRVTAAETLRWAGIPFEPAHLRAMWGWVRQREHQSPVPGSRTAIPPAVSSALDSWRPWTSDSATWREEWARLHDQGLLQEDRPVPGAWPQGAIRGVFRNWARGMLGEKLAGRPAFTPGEIARLAGPTTITKRTLQIWKKSLPANEPASNPNAAEAQLESWRPWTSGSETWLAELDSLRRQGLLSPAFAAPAEGEPVSGHTAKLLRFWLLGMWGVAAPDGSTVTAADVAHWSGESSIRPDRVRRMWHVVSQREIADQVRRQPPTPAGDVPGSPAEPGHPEADDELTELLDTIFQGEEAGQPEEATEEGFDPWPDFDAADLDTVDFGAWPDLPQDDPGFGELLAELGLSADPAPGWGASPDVEALAGPSGVPAGRSRQAEEARAHRRRQSRAERTASPDFVPLPSPAGPPTGPVAGTSATSRRDADPSADETWRHSEAPSAGWFDPPADPLRPAEWEHLRPGAEVRTVDTELADPKVRADLADGPRLRLDRYPHLVRYDVRRMEVRPGRFVQEYTVQLRPDAAAVTDAERRAVEEQVRAGLTDVGSNRGVRLPSGDQLHVRVEFVGADEPAHAGVVLLGAEDPRESHQLRWNVRDGRALAHEVLHFLGLVDENLDAGRVFLRDTGRSRVAADDGPMATAIHTGAAFKPRHAWLLERTMTGQLGPVAGWNPMPARTALPDLTEADAPRHLEPAAPDDGGFVPMPAAPEQVTVPFGKGVKTPSPADRDVVTDLGRRLLADRLDQFRQGRPRTPVRITGYGNSLLAAHESGLARATAVRDVLLSGMAAEHRERSANGEILPPLTELTTEVEAVSGGRSGGSAPGRRAEIELSHRPTDRRVYEAAPAAAEPIGYHADGVPGGVSSDPDARLGIEVEAQLPDAGFRQRVKEINAAVRRLDLISPDDSSSLMDPDDVPLTGRWHLLSEEAHENGIEFVSPVLEARLGPWRQVAEATGVLRRHGATAEATGGHVNVSFAGHTPPAAYARLAQLVKAFEATLFRLGNPVRSDRQRNLWAVGPNPWPLAPGAVRTAADVRLLSLGKYDAVNFQHVHGDDATDRVEFRFWSGSLDPAVWQVRAELSLAMLRAAADPAKAGRIADALRRADLLWRPDAAPLDEEQRWARFQELLHLLEPSPAARDQVVQLYAATRPWQPTGYTDDRKRLSTVAAPGNGLVFPAPGDSAASAVRVAELLPRYPGVQVVKVTLTPDGRHVRLWDGGTRTFREYAQLLHLRYRDVAEHLKFVLLADGAATPAADPEPGERTLAGTISEHSRAQVLAPAGGATLSARGRVRAQSVAFGARGVPSPASASGAGWVLYHEGTERSRVAAADLDEAVEAAGLTDRVPTRRRPRPVPGGFAPARRTTSGLTAVTPIRAGVVPGSLASARETASGLADGPAVTPIRAAVVPGGLAPGLPDAPAVTSIGAGVVPGGPASAWGTTSRLPAGPAVTPTRAGVTAGDLAPVRGTTSHLPGGVAVTPIRAGVVLGDPGSAWGRAARWLSREDGVFALVLAGHGLRDVAAAREALRRGGWERPGPVRLYACNVDGLARFTLDLADALRQVVYRPAKLLWAGVEEPGPAVRVGDLGFARDGSPRFVPADGEPWVRQHPGGRTEPATYDLPVPDDAPARLGLDAPEHLAPPREVPSPEPAAKRARYTTASEAFEPTGSTVGALAFAAGPGESARWREVYENLPAREDGSPLYVFVTARDGGFDVDGRLLDGAALAAVVKNSPAYRRARHANPDFPVSVVLAGPERPVAALREFAEALRGRGPYREVDVADRFVNGEPGHGPFSRLSRLHLADVYWLPLTDAHERDHGLGFPASRWAGKLAQKAVREATDHAQRVLALEPGHDADDSASDDSASDGGDEHRTEVVASWAATGPGRARPFHLLLDSRSGGYLIGLAERHARVRVSPAELARLIRETPVFRRISAAPVRRPLVLATAGPAETPAADPNDALLAELTAATGPWPAYTFTGPVGIDQDHGFLTLPAGSAFREVPMPVEGFDPAFFGSVFGFLAGEDRARSFGPVWAFGQLADAGAAPVPGPWGPRRPVFVVLDGAADHAKLGLADGPDVELTGSALGRLLLSVPEFREVLENAPDRPIVLVSAAGGARVNFGGLGFDFAGALRAAGFFPDVFAPTKGVRAGGTGLTLEPGSAFVPVSRWRAGDLKTVSLSNPEGSLSLRLVRTAGDDELVADLRNWLARVTAETFAEFFDRDGTRQAVPWDPGHPPVLVVATSPAPGRYSGVRGDDVHVLLDELWLSEVLRDDEDLRTMAGDRPDVPFLVLGLGAGTSSLAAFSAGLLPGGYARPLFRPLGPVSFSASGTLRVDGPGFAPVDPAEPGPGDLLSYPHVSLDGVVHGQFFPSQAFDAASEALHGLRYASTEKATYGRQLSGGVVQARLPWAGFGGTPWRVDGHGGRDGLVFAMLTGRPHVAGDKLTWDEDRAARAIYASEIFARAGGAGGLVLLGHCEVDGQRPGRATVGLGIKTAWERDFRPVALFGADQPVHVDAGGTVTVTGGGYLREIAPPVDLSDVDMVPLAHGAGGTAGVFFPRPGGDEAEIVRGAFERGAGDPDAYTMALHHGEDGFSVWRRSDRTRVRLDEHGVLRLLVAAGLPGGQAWRTRPKLVFLACAVGDPALSGRLAGLRTLLREHRYRGRVAGPGTRIEVFEDGEVRPAGTRADGAPVRSVELAGDRPSEPVREWTGRFDRNRRLPAEDEAALAERVRVLAEQLLRLAREGREGLDLRLTGYVGSLWEREAVAELAARIRHAIDEELRARQDGEPQHTADSTALTVTEATFSVGTNRRVELWVHPGPGRRIGSYRAAETLDVDFAHRSAELPAAHANRVRWAVQGAAVRAIRAGLRRLPPMQVAVRGQVNEVAAAHGDREAGFTALVRQALTETLAEGSARGMGNLPTVEELMPELHVTAEGDYAFRAGQASATVTLPSIPSPDPGPRPGSGDAAMSDAGSAPEPELIPLPAATGAARRGVGGTVARTDPVELRWTVDLPRTARCGWRRRTRRRSARSSTSSPATPPSCWRTTGTCRTSGSGSSTPRPGARNTGPPCSRCSTTSSGPVSKTGTWPRRSRPSTTSKTAGRDGAPAASK